MIPINKPTIVRKDLEYVLNCLITERLEEGELTREFEKSIAHLVNVKYSLAVNSFTSGLHLALLSLDLNKDDEIILPAYSNSALLNAINYISGIKPVLVDIEMETYNLDFKQVEKKLTNKTKAIILSHNFGVPSDIDMFLSLNIPIIEDCSYALGAEYDSSIKKDINKVGSFGLASIFSFDTDTIITTGNGGMLVSNTRDFILKAKQNKYNPFIESSGCQCQFDYRMPDISAAMGLSQLKIMKKLLSRRVELSDYYNERLRRSKYKIYQPKEDRKNVNSKYILFLDGNLEKTISYLRRNKIDAKKPICSPAFFKFHNNEVKFPNAFHCYNKLIEIPVYPSLKRKEIEQIANSLLKVF